MKKIWRIHWFQGISRKHHTFLFVSSFCEDREGTLYYHGDLNSFADRWDGKFLVMPAATVDDEDVIAISPYNSFSQK